MCIVDTSRWNIAFAAAVAAATAAAVTHKANTQHNQRIQSQRGVVDEERQSIQHFTVFDSRIHTKGIRNSSSFSVTFFRALMLNFWAAYGSE